MSYARFGQDGSDVYIYDDVTFGLRCMWCRLAHPHDFITDKDAAAMVAHIRAHQAAGDTVPDYVIPGILADFPAGAS